MLPKTRKLLLIDGIGAIVSSFLLVIVARNETWFGMPSMTAYGLALLAFLFATYSLVSYRFSGQKWKTYLRLIASVNIGYCLLTLSLLLWYVEQIKILGWAYFLGEISIVMTLAIFELKATKKDLV
jgi:hypothetical protein